MHKRILSVLLAVALVFTIAGVTMAAQFPGGEEPSPRVIALVPVWSGFVHDANQWYFTAMLVTPSAEVLEARFIGARLGDEFVTSLAKNEWAGILRAEGLGERLLEYEKLHKSMVVQEAQSDKGVDTAIAERYSSIRRAISKTLTELAVAQSIEVIEVTALSMPINPGETEVVELVFEVRKQNDPTLRHQVTAPTSVSALVLPPGGIEDNSVWIKGDLHIHSIYSDGAHNLYTLRDSVVANRGYHFIYMTDHVGYDTTKNLQRTVCLCVSNPCGVANTWQCYVTNTQRVSLPGIAFFPGAEINTKHVTWLGGAPGGHALIYGQNNLQRSDGQLLFGGQLSGPDLFTLRPSGSHLAIAHPTTYLPGFKWIWPTSGYRGVELMVPFDWNHSLTSSETEWWMERAFTPQALADAVAGNGVLSVRTGSDYHSIDYAQFYTHVLIPSTWNEWQTAPWASRRLDVDGGLSAGRTIASYRGGWGRVTVNGVMPGGVLRNIAANTIINFQIRFIPARNGTYTIYVFRNKLTATPVYQETVSGTAGVEITRTFSQHFPGGDQGYWFYVKGADHIYPTPVIVTSSP